MDKTIFECTTVAVSYPPPYPHHLRTPYTPDLVNGLVRPAAPQLRRPISREQHHRQPRRVRLRRGRQQVRDRRSGARHHGAHPQRAAPAAAPARPGGGGGGRVGPRAAPAPAGPSKADGVEAGPALVVVRRGNRRWMSTTKKRREVGLSGSPRKVTTMIADCLTTVIWDG